MEDKIYQFWLCQTPGLGNVKIGQLLEVLGSAEAVLRASILELGQAIDCVNEWNEMNDKRALFTEKNLGQLLTHQEQFGRCMDEYQIMQRAGVHFITPEEEAYPPAFRELYDKPQGLFLKGSLPDWQKRNVSIVGARLCTEYGRSIAAELGRRLAVHGMNVISGMAEGIDAAAHRGAIDGICDYYDYHKEADADSLPGKTLAVLGGGVDVCYPKCNMDIYKELALENGCKIFSCGGLLSEHRIGTMPLPRQFPMRNRLISALSDTLIVCEARIKSGSLITADQALEQGKEVFVVPGRITDPLSEGCNRLIEQGAGIITNLDKFVEDYFSCAPESGNDAQIMKNKLARNDEMVYSGLDFIPTHINNLLERTGMELPVLLQSLYNLQRMDMISEPSKNYYVRKL